MHTWPCSSPHQLYIRTLNGLKSSKRCGPKLLSTSCHLTQTMIFGGSCFWQVPDGNCFTLVSGPKGHCPTVERRESLWKQCAPLDANFFMRLTASHLFCLSNKLAINFGGCQSV